MKKKSVIGWIFCRVKKRIPALILLVVLSVLSALLGVGFALGTRQVIDAATQKLDQAFLEACIQQGLLILGILIVSTVHHHVRDKLASELDRDWKKSLLQGLLRGSYKDVSAYHSGELLNRMNNDVRILDGAILTLAPSVASMATKLCSAVAVLMVLEPLLTLIVVAAGIFVVIVTSFLRRRLKGLHKRASQEEGRVSGFIQETLENLLMVQAMDIAGPIEKRADVLLEQRFQIQRKRKNISVAASTCMSIMSYGAAFGALVWCAGGILEGTMTFGTMTAISQLVAQLQNPFVSISAITPQYIAMLAAAERLMEIEEISNTEDRFRHDPQELYGKMEAIEAKGLSFGYDRDRVFENASFTIQKGSFGVIVGHSGIGKSTLLKLLLGVFTPDEGKLMIRTAEGELPTDRTTGKLFAYVPQGNLLLSGTLRDNMTVTNPDATQEQIDRALYVSAMDEYLPGLPRGLETVLGENAQGLSEGQAQRLSIARAVLSDAPVLLLDEATSALDEKTEQTVLQRLRQLPGKTVIAVTHRSAAGQMADWQLEMVDGRFQMKKL